MCSLKQWLWLKQSKYVYNVSIPESVLVNPDASVSNSPLQNLLFCIIWRATGKHWPIKGQLNYFLLTQLLAFLRFSSVFLLEVVEQIRCVLTHFTNHRHLIHIWSSETNHFHITKEGPFQGINLSSSSWVWTLPSTIHTKHTSSKISSITWETAAEYHGLHKIWNSPNVKGIEINIKFTSNGGFIYLCVSITRATVGINSLHTPVKIAVFNTNKILVKTKCSMKRRKEYKLCTPLTILWHSQYSVCICG